MKFICQLGKCKRKPRVFATLEELLKHLNGSGRKRGEHQVAWRKK